MSWLFSMVLAGLMFSSGVDPVSNTNEVYRNNNINNKTVVVFGDETEKFEQSYPFNANGRVGVNNINGSITVEAWDKNEIRLEVIKVADSKETLADVQIQIDAKPDSFYVKADYGGWKTKGRDDWGRGRKMEVQFHLFVPRGAVLNEIGTVNGSVTVSNFTNQTKVSAVNGQVLATNLRGAADLSTVNGTVTADFDRIESGSRISLSTVNGQVKLAIPSDSNVTLKADSLNGDISNDFGLPVRKGKYVGRDLYGKIGTGDVQVKLSSVNGELSISHKKDGKTQGPVVNLLQTNKNDNDDWDDDEDKDDDDDGGVARIDSAKLNKHIEKSVKQAEKIAEKIKPVVVVVPEINVEAIQRAAESIRTEELESKVKATMDRQREIFARMRDLNWEGRTPVIEKKSNSFTVKGVPKVTIDARGCGVKVVGWDKPEVRYEVTRISSNRVQNPYVVTDMQDTTGVTLKVANKDAGAQAGDFFNDLSRVRVEVFVPKKSDLKIITNGEIRLEGVTGEIDLSGDDEAINVRDSGGKLHLASGDAQVRIIGFDGDLDSHTGDGDVYLEGNFAKLSARANDGTITLTLPKEANASFQSNTDVETDGIDLTQLKEGNWQLGKGGSKYTFTFSDGRLIVRSPCMIGQN